MYLMEREDSYELSFYEGYFKFADLTNQIKTLQVDEVPQGKLEVTIYQVWNASQYGQVEIHKPTVLKIPNRCHLFLEIRSSRYTLEFKKVLFAVI
jgi:hypothetical protein